MKIKIKTFINYQEKKINCNSLKKNKTSNQKSISAILMKMKLSYKMLNIHLKINQLMPRFNQAKRMHKISVKKILCQSLQLKEWEI
jgi:RNase adaptor protein for sRNA GlmZ degradation